MRYKEYNSEVAWNLAARMGLVLAGLWTVSFLIVVLNIPSLLCDLGYLLGLMSVFVMGKNVRGIATYVMPMNWTQRLSLSLMSFMGCVLITTLAQFLYLAFLDHGHFMHAMQESLTDPGLVKVMQDGGNGALLQQATETIGQMADMSPRQLTISFFSSNMTLAFVFSLIASMFRGRPEKSEGQ